MKTIMVVGGCTLLYGLMKGRGKSGKEAYQERVNEIRLQELDIEMEMLKL